MFDAMREYVLPRLEAIRPSGSGYSARCPAHDDSTASLSVSRGDGQPVVLHCHAGCNPDDIIAKLGLTWEQLTNPREKREDTAVRAYDYTDENGILLYQVVRQPDKRFLQRIPDPTAQSGWTWRLGNTRRVLYRLGELIQGIKDGREVWIPEGEKDADTFAGLNMIATCNSGGAGKWLPEFAVFFADAIVTIVADRDDPGYEHARRIRDSLIGIATSVQMVEAKSGKDATDHFSAGHTVDEFVVIWSDREEPELDLDPDLWEFLGTVDEEPDWVVPGLLERRDRLIFTGFEGLGKSMMLRQMAVTIAAGLHPFRFTSITPRRVLMIDCENSERQSRRRFRPLADASIDCMHRVPDGALRLIHRPEGLDLTSSRDEEWLMERVTANKPDILFIGPFYRLHNANINDEVAAKRVLGILDRARVKADCALVIEAHAGHGKDKEGNRSPRPAGSSVLLRWPEFGIGITPPEDDDREAGVRCKEVRVVPWRGGRDERYWPDTMGWNPKDYGWPWLQISPV